MKLWIFITLIVLLAAMVGVSCSTSRGNYETPAYKVLLSDGDFELREYPPLKLAATQRTTDNESFMRLFRYIDGSNESREKIAMTTPVFMTKDEMNFVVPEKNKADTPAPSSTQVTIKAQPARRLAVLRFPGRTTAADEKARLSELRTWMQKQHLQESGEPVRAGYDPPWTPGFLRRNEVLLPVQ